MGVFSEKLFELGLIAEKQFREQQAGEFLEGEQQQQAQYKTMKNGYKLCDELDTCPTMREFKHVAKQILLGDTSQIRVIIQKAHRFKENKKFIWFFYQVKDGLSKLPTEKHERFLDKAFRKSGSTITLPD